MRPLILLTVLAFTSQLAGPSVTAQPNKPAEPAGSVIDINQADVATLTVLPGIGPSLAQRIVDLRSKRPFRNKRELRRVKGIGFRKFSKLAPLVTVGAPASAKKTRAKKQRAKKSRTNKASRARK